MSSKENLNVTYLLHLSLGGPRCRDQRQSWRGEKGYILRCCEGDWQVRGPAVVGTRRRAVRGSASKALVITVGYRIIWQRVVGRPWLCIQQVMK